MRNVKIITTGLLSLLLSISAYSQEKKIWVSGAARGVMYADEYNNSSENDSTTARKLQSGHAMVDLGVNIQPNENILIQSMVRIRNDYGGFWGSGVTFDVRQLYIKGIIGGFLRYQLGDINYKLSPYTFQNNVGLVNKYQSNITGIPLDQLQYDLFYNDDNTWRQQGAAVDFALEFSKIVDEVEFNIFTTRNRPSDQNTIDDRLYSGGSMVIKQSKNLNLGLQYANLYDYSGTSNSTIFLRNPVLTASAEYTRTIGKIDFNMGLETGRSTLEWSGDDLAPVLEDYFYDISASANHKKTGLSANVSYRDVGANFRSAGAQTIQVNYDRAPIAYQRIGNDQELRAIGLMDVYRDASLYQTQIQAGLMTYDPRYDNATPYGRATPNRRGVSLEVEQNDLKKRWTVSAQTEILSDIVGQGTEALKGYNTSSFFIGLNIDKFISAYSKELFISARLGMQNTSRSDEEIPEKVDLQTNFNIFDLRANIAGGLDLIGEYRIWKTSGFDMQAERNEYSQIIDYSEYRIDYNESVIGAGLQYNFNSESRLSLMWQTFDWKDNAADALAYDISTWTIYFTMNF